MRDRFVALVLAAAAGFLALVFPFGPTAAEGEDGEWPIAAPAEVGLDGERLGDLTETIRRGRKYPRVTSLLIVRHGKLALEEYFDGGSDDLRTLQSVTKSFASALIGIAIARGEVEDVSETIIGIPPGIGAIANMDDRKRRITIADLLTMRSGTDYHERGRNSPHGQLNRTPTGWDKFYLDRPMINEPGTVWRYDSGGAIFLSAILKARAGQYADGYADEHLFGPLGITETRWFRNKEGHTHTGGGLYLRSRDMAKFGQLFLQDGMWNGEQVIPAAWVERSTSPIVRPVPHSAPNMVGYGYLWWIMRPDPAGAGSENIYTAYGANGQFIMVVPEHVMVVVATGKTGSYRNEVNPLRFLYTDILPAVLR